MSEYREIIGDRPQFRIFRVRVKTQAKSVIARYRHEGIHMDRNGYIYTYVYISAFCINHYWASRQAFA